MDNLCAPSANHLEEIARNRKLNLQEQFAQYENLRSMPLHVAVPTGDRCNLRCIFCTDRNPSTARYTDQTFEGFLRFVEPVDKASLVQLYGWGEPFVNRVYEKMFDYVTSRFAGARIYISTNGVLLSGDRVERILAYGKCLINISLNAATPETYVAITGYDRFNRVVRNIRELIQGREERNEKDLVITLSFTATRINIHEFPRFIELSDDLGIKYVVLQDLNLLEESHVQLYLGKEEKVARGAFEEANNLARQRGIYLDSFMHLPGKYFQQDRTECAPYELPRDCLAVWDQEDDAPFHPQAGECYEPWMTFLMSQNGAVSTCCRAREVMGNIYEKTFEEIWNGEMYRMYRRTINSFRPPEACRGCPVKTGHDVR
jgi:radical SAM protein with 4Fe4S-binding SPASM domain